MDVLELDHKPVSESQFQKSEENTHIVWNFRSFDNLRRQFSMHHTASYNNDYKTHEFIHSSLMRVYVVSVLSGIVRTKASAR